MTGYIGKVTNLPREVIGVQAQSEREDLFGPMPGKIVKYDAATQTATVQPLTKKILPNGQVLDYPEMLEVPIDFPRTANMAFTSPIPVGSKVMLTPMARNMENYDTEDNGEPFDTRSYHLSDMRATITGGDPLTDPLKNVDPDNTHIRFDAEGKFGIRGSPDGRVKIEGREGNIYEMVARLAEMFAEHQTVVTKGSSAGLYNHDLRGEALGIAARLRGMVL